jgi:putative alpha-1,2-mannosidase
MPARIDAAGGAEKFEALLDHFFGFNAEPLERPTRDTPDAEMNRQLEVGRFEGLNNEPDMETPHAYRWINRDEKAERVLDAVFKHQFTTGRGGLPGNDDSGGLSSWYVWHTLGLCPVAGQDRLIRGRCRVNAARVRWPDGDELALPLPAGGSLGLPADALKRAAVAAPADGRKAKGSIA